LRLAADILDTQPGQTLVLADAEHFTVELLDKVKSQTNFDLLVPMPDPPSRRKKLQEFPPKRSDRAGLATRPRSWLILPGTARQDRSTNTFSGRESGPRSITSRHSSRQRTATKLSR